MLDFIPEDKRTLFVIEYKGKDVMKWEFYGSEWLALGAKRELIGVVYGRFNGSGEAYYLACAKGGESLNFRALHYAKEFIEKEAVRLVQ